MGVYGVSPYKIPFSPKQRLGAYGVSPYKIEIIFLVCVHSKEENPRSKVQNQTMQNDQVEEAQYKNCHEKRLQHLQQKYDNINVKFFEYAEKFRQAKDKEIEATREYNLALTILTSAQQLFKEANTKKKAATKVLGYATHEGHHILWQKSEILATLTAAKKEDAMKKRTDFFNKQERRDQNTESKKNVLNLDLLEAKMPVEIMKLIASYIPYCVRIQMITHFHHPLYYLKEITAEGLKDFIFELYKHEQTKNICTTELLLESNDQFSQITWYIRRKEESLRRIKFMMTLFKQIEPEFALRILKYLAIIEKNAKNYKYNYKNHHLTNFVLPKSQSSEFAWREGAYSMRNAVC